ncbi:S-layer homology domain-containing protein [Bacillus mycoides]|uniref:S-layer protein n=1 Tax=Bacillus cereus TaxID=1396 RepID=A0A1S9V8C0_BACCE|nr:MULTISPECIES: S-layer homology domain-containing protein [Bacillus cereus group]OOR30649.1 S-layer protein [Bacillus cereus]QWG43863.1 S-layer homology domain-containing protein [Bacillus mycoides]QWH10943.1 S-layer homology domain-containing protein [Bacillus mycoides]
MKKKFLKIATALTIMGGVVLSAEGTKVNAEVVVKQQQQANSVVFKDVPKDHWSSEAIHTLAGWGIINGYGNGNFGFGDNVTREQVAALIYRTIDFSEVFEEGDVLENPYKDINENSTMFIEEILVLTEVGILKGDGTGNFRPKDTLTREEMAQVLTNAFELEAKGPHTFNDVPADSWAKNAISAIQTNNITNGIGENKFGPSMSVTREQYATFLYRAILNDEQQ